jgi:hypothetical protein
MSLTAKYTRPHLEADEECGRTGRRRLKAQSTVDAATRTSGKAATDDPNENPSRDVKGDPNGDPSGYPNADPTGEAWTSQLAR